MAGLQTEYSFTLPKGYVDGEGNLHRHGTMRLATARDEMEPLRDPRISSTDDPYLTILVLSRVITELGTVRQITPSVVENLFAADLAFLQDLYGIINFGDPDDVEALQRSVTSGRERAEDPGEPLAEVPATAPEPVEDAESEIVPVRRRDRIEEVARAVER